MVVNRSSDFASLFKKYRLRSEIETLTEFGDLLAEKGVIYDNTIFTRWQKGQRTPKNRTLLLKIVELFAKRGGIKNIDEANEILASINQRDLTDEEANDVQDYFAQSRLPSIPEKGDIFIGRENILKDIGWQLINKKKVLVYGVPGIGKTALAIELGHLLADSFGDGVFWFRADLKQIESVVDEMLNALGYDTSGVTNMKLKLEKLARMVKKRNILLILDNIDDKQTDSEIFEQILKLPVAILLTSVGNIENKLVEKLKIGYFSKEEYMSLAHSLLGPPFVEANREKLEEIGHLLGYLPISSVIILKQIAGNPRNIDEYIRQVKYQNFELKDAHYDNKDLYSALEFSFMKLTQEQQEILKAASVFDGVDFGLEPLKSMIDVPKPKLKQTVEKLIDLSLVERSVKNRYRLHPAVKRFLEKKLNNDLYHYHLSQYYLNQIEPIKRDNLKYIPYVDKEFENIAGVIVRLNKSKNYRELIKLANSLNLYLYQRGKWEFMHEINKIWENAFIKSGDWAGLAYYYSEDIGKICYFQNKFKEAEDYATKSLKIAKKIKNELLIGLALQKFGIIFNEKGKPHKALKALEKSIYLLKKHKNELEVLRSYVYLGNVYKRLNDFENAEKSYKVAFNNATEVTAMALMFLGDIYLKQNRLKEALKLFEKSLIIEERDRRKIGIAVSLMGIAKIKKRIGKRKEAEELAVRANQLFHQLQIDFKANYAWHDLINID